MHQSIQTTR